MNLRKSVDQFCFDCIYDETGIGAKHQQTEDCTATNCPLYEHRPLTGKTRARIKQERYDALSPEDKAKYDEKAEVARKRLAGIKKS